MENVIDFIGNTNLFRKFQVDNLLFAEFECPYEEGMSGIWWHDNFFAYILAGKSLLKTPRNEYTLEPGDCVFGRKGSVLSATQTREGFCELLIFVPDNFIKSVIEKYELTLGRVTVKKIPDTIIPIETDRILTTYFQSLLQYFTRSQSPSRALLKLKFEELIVHLMTHAEFNVLRCYFQEICSRSKQSVSEIMEYNFCSNLSLEEFARMCARSLSGFKRDFKKQYGIPPGRWLREKRLEHSKFLLENANLNIGEVCLECGFENRSHFIREFRKKYGTPPGVYRRDFHS